MKTEYRPRKITFDLIYLCSELSEIYDQIKEYESLDVNDEGEHKDEYEQFLDDCNENITFNNTVYCYSEVLKELQPYSYEQGFSEWVEFTYLEPLDESLNEKYDTLRENLKLLFATDSTAKPHLWECLCYLDFEKTLTWYRCNLRYLLKELKAYIIFLKDKYQIKD